MNKPFMLLLCAAFLMYLAAGCGSGAPGVDGGTTTTTSSPTQAADPKGSQQLGNNIMKLMKSLDYPAYYGGCYVDEENALVILVTDTEQAKEGLKDALSSWEEQYYRFEAAPAAYKELLSLQEQVSAIHSELAELGVQVTSSYIGIGYVSVGILELDDAKEQAFRQLLDSPLIELRDSPGINTD